MEVTFKEYFFRKSKQSHIYNMMERFNGEEVVWSTLTDQWLDAFADYVRESISGSSAYTYFSFIKSVLCNAIKAGLFTKESNYRELLTSKKNKVVKTFLSVRELKLIENYTPDDEIEESVRADFLISAYTGMRASDFSKINEDNIDQDGNLVYISEKTSIKSTIPLKPLVRHLISIPRKEVTLKTYNLTIRDICRKCKINSSVQVMRGGNKMSGEKWQYVSSHAGRRSFATNLYLLGLDIFSISKLMGHSDIEMTMRYICSDVKELPAAVKRYFE